MTTDRERFFAKSQVEGADILKNAMKRLLLLPKVLDIRDDARIGNPSPSA